LLTKKPSNEITLGPWRTSYRITQVEPIVSAFLLRSNGGLGTVWIIGRPRPQRYIRADKLSGKTQLVILNPGEELLLVGSLSIRFIRFPNT
jgi:hypothetical protein